jgi:hypothetical protein
LEKILGQRASAHPLREAGRRRVARRWIRSAEAVRFDVVAGGEVHQSGAQRTAAHRDDIRGGYRTHIRWHVVPGEMRHGRIAVGMMLSAGVRHRYEQYERDQNDDMPGHTLPP